MYKIRLYMPTKVNIVGRNIFDNTRLEMNVPSSSIVQVPVVTKKQYTLVDISEDMYVSMIDENSNVREDIKINEEMYNKIKDKMYDNEILLTCMAAVGIEKITDYKIVT